MAIKCPITGCQSSDEWTDITGLMDHIKNIHEANSIGMPSENIRLDIPYTQVVVNKEECYVMKTPFMIEYSGVHFLMVIMCVKEKFYFWMYRLEEGVLPDGRQFFGRITLEPETDTASPKASEQNIIYPVTAPAQEIMERKNGLLFVHNRGFIKNFLSRNRTFHVAFSIQELEKEIILPEIENLDDVTNEGVVGRIEIGCHSGTVYENTEDLAYTNVYEGSDTNRINCPQCYVVVLEFEPSENIEFEETEYDEFETLEDTFDAFENVGHKLSGNVKLTSSASPENSDSSKNNYVTVKTGMKKPAISLSSLIKYMDFSAIKLPFSDWELSTEDYMKRAVGIFFEKRASQVSLQKNN